MTGKSTAARLRILGKLPAVLSATEVSGFFQHVCTIRYRAALMTAYGAGLLGVAAMRIFPLIGSPVPRNRADFFIHNKIAL